MLTETLHTAEFLLSEANGSISRAEVVIDAGAPAMVAGTVMGQITKGAATAAHVAGGTGNSTFSAVTVGVNSVPGVYQLIFTAATKVNVEDPSGVLLGVATLGTAFTAGGLTFTITAGGTPHIATDRATITVAAGSRNYVPYLNTAADGSEVAAGILYAAVPNSDAAQPAVIIARHAEVRQGALTGYDAPAGIDLAALQIFVR